MKKAFTLAEVLITLGIIGIVAAMTIPTLISNYQKKQFITGLKVAYSTLTQGIQRAMADDGVSDFRQTELYKTAKWDNHRGENETKSMISVPLNKYLRVTEIISQREVYNAGGTSQTITDTATCKKLVGKYGYGWYLNDETKCYGFGAAAVHFANGMTGAVNFSDYGYHSGYFIIDINGEKGPNTWGRDVFYLIILNDGYLSPQWGRKHLKAYVKYNNRNIDDETIQRTEQNYMNQCTSAATIDGVYCTTRILGNGWVMDY